MVGLTVFVLLLACTGLALALHASHRRAERERTLREFFSARQRGPAPVGNGRPAVPAPVPAATAPAGVPPPVPVSPLPLERAPATTERTAPGSTGPALAMATSSRPEPAAPFRIEATAGLPTFTSVGGMQALKDELTDTVGLLLRDPESAAAYGIAWNGLLLHGPAGVGKTFFARAIAGQFGLDLLHVSTGDLVEGIAGESARNVQRAFEAAQAHRPCLLLFDEFDSVAQRRDTGSHPEERRTVNQLLTSLEKHRDEPGVIVVAATNDLDHLDPAVVRPGRFDRHVRVDLPDDGARASILLAQLAHRPACDALDLEVLARRTEGLTPAALTQVVDAAALTAMREASETGVEVRITTDHVLDALAARGGKDRPCIGDWAWEDLVLPDGVEHELRQLQAMLTDPDLSERLGVDPPAGVLLAGPPGTGKTTIGRVLAAQSGCSFYPVSAADVTSKWVGESERSLQRLFERARAHRPSIVFIDEIDALGARRESAGESASRQLNQLLVEMDGLRGRRGLLVVGATNRPELLDPALVRGGRLSRTITLSLPDEAARRAILAIAAARMPTVGVDLAQIAAHTAGRSGADLKALCQQAALQALVRTRAGLHAAAGTGDDHPLAVLGTDFDEALADLA